MTITWLALVMVPLTKVAGHGNMVYPPVWMHQDHNIGCGVLDLPDTEHEHVNGNKLDCLNMWFTNYTEIPGEQTIPENMTQPEKKCSGHNWEKKPWMAPGTAPIFSPCGTMGGNPLGCHNGEDSSEQFGDCCGGNCGGFSFGSNAETYEWPGAPTTEWFAGSIQEVAWHVSANHGGGYSYRLCKMPKGGIEELTEECFQDMPLEFIGDKQWVSYGGENHHWESEDDRIEVTAKRTTEGTFPPGSMWTVDPINPHDDHSFGHIIDQVKIPMELESGEYVLSFRWDCKCTPQVWSVCSNILVI